MVNLKNAKSYCKDYTKIENYEKAINDKTQVWECHHRLEISPMGNHYSKEYLIKQGLYFNQSPDALIFLTRSEHKYLHAKNPIRKRKMSESHKGKKPYEMTEETKQKIAEAMKGIRHQVSNETRKKISDYHKGKHHSEETKKKISQVNKGKHWKLVNGKRVWY